MALYRSLVIPAGSWGGVKSSPDSDTIRQTGCGPSSSDPSKIMQVWLIAALLFLGLIAINISFFMCACAIRRDVTRRFDDLQRRLETRATDLVNLLFDTRHS